MPRRTGIGNCNVNYVTNLRACYPNMEQALAEIVWTPPTAWSKGTYALTLIGIVLFAQGSEDSVKTNPYGPQLKDLILKYGLGEVWESGPTPNVQHNNKPGILYMWKLDHKAIKAWAAKHIDAKGKFIKEPDPEKPKRVRKPKIAEMR